VKIPSPLSSCTGESSPEFSSRACLKSNNSSVSESASNAGSPKRDSPSPPHRYPITGTESRAVSLNSSKLEADFHPKGITPCTSSEPDFSIQRSVERSYSIVESERSLSGISVTCSQRSTLLGALSSGGFLTAVISISSPKQ
jgi:hypothetical protein